MDPRRATPEDAWASRAAPVATNHRPDAKNLTWVCGCGQVEFEVAYINVAHNVCYCDDCVNRIRIGREKSPSFNGFYHENGGCVQADAYDKNIKFLKGQDLVAGFRCAVKNKGTEFDERRSSVSAYASCCGTLMYTLLDPHPGLTMLNNCQRLKGWKPHDDEKYIFVPPGFECTEYTGHKFPSGAPAKWQGMCCGPANLCCGGQHGLDPEGNKLHCEPRLHLLLCSVCCLGKDRCCSRCCPPLDCCCMISKNPALTMPPPGASEFNGRPLEYYRETKYLWPPKMAGMGNG